MHGILLNYERSHSRMRHATFEWVFALCAHISTTTTETAPLNLSGDTNNHSNSIPHYSTPLMRVYRANTEPEFVKIIFTLFQLHIIYPMQSSISS